MGDKITIEDAVFLAAIPELFDGKGWHGKGKTPKAFDEESLQRALFEHDFADAGILLPDGTFHATGERYAIARDTGKPIGNAVGERYATPSNLELFRIMKEVLAGSRYEIVSTGTLDNRAEFFIDAKGKNVRAGGRDIAPFVGLNRSFGGFRSITVSGHSTVIQCANTTSLFRREAEKREDAIRVKNTLNIFDRLEWFKKQIEAVHGVQAEFAKAMASAAKTKINLDEAREGFAGLIGRGKPLATKGANRIVRLTELFQRGAGNGGENGADFYSAVTDYYSHESAGSADVRKPDEVRAFKDKQWYSSEFGNGRNLKAEFTATLMQKGEFRREEFDRLRDLGRESIRATDKETALLLN